MEEMDILIDWLNANVLNEFVFVQNFSDIQCDGIFWIQNDCHAILRQDNVYFNPNIYDYKYTVPESCTMNIIQIEPSYEVYNEYWNFYDDIPFIENDSNCHLWVLFYKWYLTIYKGNIDSFVIFLNKLHTNHVLCLDIFVRQFVKSRIHDYHIEL